MNPTAQFITGFVIGFSVVYFGFKLLEMIF
jgi:hypothetical protein